MYLANYPSQNSPTIFTDEPKIVGKPGTKRRDIAPKLYGTVQNNMVDVKVPGMLHGRMIRPPIAGAVPVAVDES